MSDKINHSEHVEVSVTRQRAQYNQLVIQILDVQHKYLHYNMLIGNNRSVKYLCVLTDSGKLWLCGNSGIALQASYSNRQQEPIENKRT